MKDNYVFEPSHLEIVLTELVENTLAISYYWRVIERLGIKAEDKVLDYCSGSGILSKKIAKRLKQGQLIYTEVSEKWLMQSTKKLKHNRNSIAERIRDFQGPISGGNYDKILIHFSLHDFPYEYRLRIINQLIENLNVSGSLFIWEPLGSSHGIQLHELINILEYTKKLSYEYVIEKTMFTGKYVAIKANLKQNKREIDLN